jgi:hypothetical protein
MLQLMFMLMLLSNLSIQFLYPVAQQTFGVMLVAKRHIFSYLAFLTFAFLQQQKNRGKRQLASPAKKIPNSCERVMSTH